MVEEHEAKACNAGHCLPGSKRQAPSQHASEPPSVLNTTPSPSLTSPIAALCAPGHVAGQPCSILEGSRAGTLHHPDS